MIKKKTAQWALRGGGEKTVERGERTFSRLFISNFSTRREFVNSNDEIDCARILMPILLTARRNDLKNVMNEMCALWTRWRACESR